jgi:glycosyltransferase involved in cell wall biosynthesis
MRILHIYSGNLFGGIERVLLTLAKEPPASQRMEHTFALCFKGRLSQELRSLGARVHELHEVRFSRPWTVWSARRRIHDLLKEEPFDLVMTHSCWTQLLAYPVARGTQLPLVLWVHDAMGDGHWLDRMVRHRPPDLCLANSRYTMATVTRALPDVECRVQHLPVPAPPLEERSVARAEIRQELATPDATLVVAMASRFERWKGHRLLLQSLAGIQTKRPWECWIAGGVQRKSDTMFLAELKEFADRLGISSRIRWLGERQDIYRLRTADRHCFWRRPGRADRCHMRDHSACA